MEDFANETHCFGSASGGRLLTLKLRIIKKNA